MWLAICLGKKCILQKSTIFLNRCILISLIYLCIASGTLLVCRYACSRDTRGLCFPFFLLQAPSFCAIAFIAREHDVILLAFFFLGQLLSLIFFLKFLRKPINTCAAAISLLFNAVLPGNPLKNSPKRGFAFGLICLSISLAYITPSSNYDAALATSTTLQALSSRVTSSISIFLSVTLYLLWTRVQEKAKISELAWNTLRFSAPAFLLSLSAHSKSNAFTILTPLILLLLFMSANIAQKLLSEFRVHKRNLAVVAFALFSAFFIASALDSFLRSLLGTDLISLLEYRMKGEFESALDTYRDLTSSEGYFPFLHYSKLPLSLAIIPFPGRDLMLNGIQSLGHLLACRGLQECIDSYRYELLVPLQYWLNFDGGIYLVVIGGSIYIIILRLLSVSFSLSKDKGAGLVSMSLLYTISVSLTTGKFLWTPFFVLPNLIVTLLLVSLFSFGASLVPRSL